MSPDTTFTIISYEIAINMNNHRGAWNQLGGSLLSNKLQRQCGSEAKTRHVYFLHVSPNFTAPRPFTARAGVAAGAAAAGAGASTAATF